MKLNEEVQVESIQIHHYSFYLDYLLYLHKKFDIKFFFIFINLRLFVSQFCISSNGDVKVFDET